jgi:uncharacterized membrane protein
MRKALMTGLAILMPLIVTVYFFIFMINLAAIPFLFISKKIFNAELLNRFDFIDNHLFIQTILAKCMAIAFLFLVSLTLGVMAQYAIKKYIIDKPLNLLRNIPILGFAFSFTSSLSKKIFDHKKRKFFKKTVLVPFFGNNKYVLGLVTSEQKPKFIPSDLKVDSAVFIPSCPHPVSGFLVFSEIEALNITKLDPDKAFAYIMSCGSSEK